MRSARIAVAMAGAALAALVGTYLAVRPSGEPGGSGRAVSAAPEADLLTAPVPPDDAPRLRGTRGPAPTGSQQPPSAAASAAKPRHAVLTVTTEDAGGRPVAGAHVRAYGTFEWDGIPSRPSLRAEARTGPDGRVELEVPVSPKEMAWPGPVVVHAWSEGAAAVSEVLDPWAPNPRDVRRRDVRLTLAVGTVISGRVVSDAGVPVPGASVTLGQALTLLLGTETDGRGEFEFPPLPAARLGDRVPVRASSPTYASGESELHAPYASDMHATLVVRALRVVTGRIVGPEGQPVVAVLDTASGQSAKTDEAGRFEVRVARRGDVLVVLPPAPLVARTVRIPPDGPSDLDLLALWPGESVRGRLVVSAEFPWPLPLDQWWVECQSEALGRFIAQVRADAKGQFEITGVGEGVHVLRSTWGTHVADVLAAFGETRGVRAGDRDVTLTVGQAAVLRVEARTADGALLPVRGWYVEATGPLPDVDVLVRSQPDRGRDWSDPRGGFVVGLTRPGTYRLRVKLPGYRWVEREKVDVGTSEEKPLALTVVPEAP